MTPDEKIPEPVRQGSFLFAFISVDFDSLRRAAPCNVSNTTHVVERCHPQRNRRGGNLPSATSRIQPVWLNETTPDMSFRANAVSRGIYSSCNFYLVSVPLPTWWIPPLRFAPVGMTKTGYVSTDSPTVSRAFYAAPRPSSVRATPCQLPPREALVPCFRGSGLPVRREGLRQNLPLRGRGTAVGGG